MADVEGQRLALRLVEEELLPRRFGDLAVLGSRENKHTAQEGVSNSHVTKQLRM